MRQRAQQGMATLLVVISLLALATMVLLFSSRQVSLEQYNAQSQHRYHRALGYAEEGLEAAWKALAAGSTTPPADTARYTLRYSKLDDSRYLVISSGLYDGHRVSVQQRFELGGGAVSITLPCGKKGGKAVRAPQHDPVLAVTGKLDFFGSIHQTHGMGGAQAASCFPVGEDLHEGSSNPPPNATLPDWGAGLEKNPPKPDVPNSSGAPLNCKGLQAAISQAQGGKKPWVIAGPVEIAGSCSIDGKGQPQDVVISGDIQLHGVLMLSQMNLVVVGDLIGRPASSLAVYGIGNGFDFDRLEGDGKGEARIQPGSWIDSGSTP